MNQFLKGFNVLRHKIKFTNQQSGWQHLPNRNADIIMCLELNAQQRASIQSLNMEEQITEVINLHLRTSPDTFGGSSFLLAESTIVVTISLVKGRLAPSAPPLYSSQQLSLASTPIFPPICEQGLNISSSRKLQMGMNRLNMVKGFNPRPLLLVRS